MNKPFFEASKKIANDYLQSIVFIDDKAYENLTDGQGPNINHDFNALKVSEAFAKKNKICAIYRPTQKSDIDFLSLIAQKADIVILDWFIHIDKTIIQNEEEEDDVVDDHRGSFTLDLISKIICSDSQSGLKIIMVYTGDTDLPGITEAIRCRLLKDNIKITTSENCRIISDSLIVSIIYKSKGGDENPFKYNPDLKEKVKTYEELPEVLLNEFTNLTAGLLSNFALKALTEIRNNSSKLLNTFSKKIDPAYLSHQSLLPNQDDANNLLVELLIDSIGGILRYKNINKAITPHLIELWIKGNVYEKSKNILNGESHETKHNYSRTHKLLKDVLNSKELDVENRFKTCLIPNGFTEKTIKSYQNVNNISLFTDLSVVGQEEILKEFALLTHSKSCYIPSSIEPVLSLGSVIKSSIEKNGCFYYICIQQRCDSTRITKPRRFLFIPLKEIKKGPFNLVTPNGEKLRIINNSYSLRTIKFAGDPDEFVVKATKKIEKFYFNQLYTQDNEELEWIFDLKDLTAQKIANDYAMTLSRVGLDESEWIRRSRT